MFLTIYLNFIRKVMSLYDIVKYMQIQDLLSLKPLINGRLRTGSIGLKHPIESAMILEAVDIERWGAPNQLILTSFYALNDLNQTDLEAFFAKLQHIGISGIILKLNRLIDSTPDNLISLCYQHDIPLLEIDGKTSYERILTAIYEPLLNRQSSLLRTYYDASKMFSSLKNAKASYQEILEQLAQLIGKSCRLKIPRKDLVLEIGQLPDYHWDFISFERLSTEYTNNIYTVKTLVNNQTQEESYQISIKYQSHQLIPFTIDIFQNHAQFDHSHIMVVENAMEAIQHKLQIEQSVNHEYYNIYNNIAASILFNTTANKQERDDLLEETGLHHYPYYQAIGIGKHISHDGETLRQVRKRLQGISPYQLYYENRKYIIILYNLNSKQNAITSKTLAKLLDSPTDYNLVISSLTDKDGIHNLFNECLDMIRFNREYHVFNLMTITDLGIFRHLLDANQTFFDTSLSQELRQLKENKPDFFDTFLNFILCHQNYQLTAERMFLHPKTVRYRINKVQEILNFDLQNPIQYLNYAITTLLTNINPD